MENASNDFNGPCVATELPAVPKGLSMIFIRIATVAAALMAATLPSLSHAAADDSPMITFNDHCRQCHSYAKDDNRLGPSLYGVVGRAAGSVKGFSYSEPLQNSKITWTPDMLDKWITNPNAVVPGNNMGAIFAGLSDAAARKKIIEFLQSDTAGPGAKK